MDSPNPNKSTGSSKEPTEAADVALAYDPLHHTLAEDSNTQARPSTAATDLSGRNNDPEKPPKDAPITTGAQGRVRPVLQIPSRQPP